MKNKISFLLLCVVMVVAFAAINVSATVSPKVSVGSVSGEYGEVIEIPVILTGNTGFSSLGVEIEYDETALKLTNVSPNSTIGAVCTKAQELDVNPYNIGWNSASNNTFNGTLAALTFEIITETIGEYPVNINFYKGRYGNYTDGYDVNYNENFESLNLVYSNGNVSVLGENSVQVTVNGKSATLSTNESMTGKIIVAVYDGKMHMETFYTYSPLETINLTFNDITCNNTVKIMWWDTVESVNPKCYSKVLNFY